METVRDFSEVSNLRDMFQGYLTTGTCLQRCPIGSRAGRLRERLVQLSG